MRKIVPFLLIALSASRALAVKVADITRLGGQRTNIIIGVGLVYGLKGTGDGGDFSAAINPLREMLAKFADPVTVKELANAQNVAIVTLTATLPANGVRDGDHLDVHVTSMGAANSLKGGRLIITPMMGFGDLKRTLAMADGPVDLEDPSVPTGGVIRAAAGGAVMEENFPARSVDDSGHFTLILDEPSVSWPMASTIAQIINDSEGNGTDTVASVYDQKNIIVTIPANEREHPDAFISRVLRLPVKIVASEARVQINSKTGTIVMTGDVEISPVVITHKGLSISTISPPPIPSKQAPVVTNKDVIAVGTDHEATGNLQDLIGAMEQLQVPAQDRIDIIKELYDTGKLHAKLIMDD